MNRWGIPKEVEDMVLKRDDSCVYCRVDFGTSRKAASSWEHIINDIAITSLENIARCCVSCNASKGTKSLKAWFERPYCKKNGINKDSVAEIVKAHIRKYC